MAHAEFFGDAFQYTHRVLLRAIAPPDEWIVHPMLFRSVGGGPPGGGLVIADYAQFCGLPYTAVLPEGREGRRLTRQTMVADVQPYPQSTEEMSVGAGRRCKKVLLCFWDNGL